ncbi:MAG: hypothetical protein IPK00_20365 [Deltaproteobacteria bacterium]|nr:hypothetical protein [Deltaproteobacteria bacterium]
MTAIDTSPADDTAYRRALLRLIAIGGSGVLASYLLALDPAISAGLWGGIPEGRIRELYTLNMFLAAFGFFPATWWLVFATPASALRERTGFGLETLFIAYATILMASALWLPLTALYVKSPSPFVWLLVRGVLLAVGIAATLLGAMLVRLAARGRPLAWLAVFSFFFFWLQTMVLDALVWPHYYSTGA